MTDKKNWGHTVLGWFVVKEADEGGDAPRHTGDLPEPASEPAPPPVTFVKEVPKAEGGVVDFSAVLDAAGIEAADRDLFSKAQALLSGLPPGIDPKVGKQIAEASLKAFGIPIEKIIESGVESIQALEAYIQIRAAGTAGTAKEIQGLIEDYEKRIRETRDLLDKKLAEQASVQTQCNAKKLELQKVLEFFGQDEVARVVRESPKLIDPSAPPDRKG